MPFKSSHKVLVQFVGKGLRADDYDGCVTSDMCTPIAPASSHPSAREALKPFPEFPFDDCYQYTFVTAIVRIPNQRYPRRHFIELDSRDIVMHSMSITEDYDKHVALKKERGFPLEPYEEDCYPADSTSDYGQEAGDEHHSRYGTDTESVGSAASSFDDALDADDMAAIFFSGDEAFENPEVDDIPVTVKASVNLHEIDEVIDPAGFLKEEADLRRIIREAKARTINETKSERTPTAGDPDVQMSDETEPAGGRDQRSIIPLEVDQVGPAADVGECVAKAEKEESQTYLGTEGAEKTSSPLVNRCQTLRRFIGLGRCNWWKRSCIARGLRLVRSKICKVLRAVARVVRLRKGNTRR
ncbi:uncharacterized protein B0H18DRAFT_546522 [Fomitopsis serialis]|uniref:uncharacterized protein n=1 Tax=Fomitopsis serialis TaxID=139415 RepID=UPI002007686D|nr:uncharacterized protein B0H18DRAFT_546522 [Neoantrodia serialis]KAH9934177.1 hypothetical protein B0H18DRAFT_546522 [Neoantrodia serialis]